MKMADRIAGTKRKAKQIKSDHPSSGLNARLDIAAQANGAKHYTQLHKLQTLLGEDGVPSRIAILQAGGNAADSPMRAVDNSVTLI